MASLPRPLIGLFVAAVAFFAIWTVALKPGSSSSGSRSGSSPSPNAYSAAIAKAHAAAAATAKQSAADGAPVAAATTAKVAPATHAAPARTRHVAPGHAAVRPAATNLPSMATVMQAIASHKTVALLVFNPSGADDTAVKAELASIPTHRGQVAKFAVPENQLSHFSALTNRVPVNGTPTLILIDKRGHASSLVGFVDQLEMAQRISDTLRVK
jgi:hypothetical protein